MDNTWNLCAMLIATVFIAEFAYSKISQRFVSTSDDVNFFERWRKIIERQRMNLVSRSLFFLTPRVTVARGKGREHDEFMINARETRDLI